jgi:hypothetical protein
MNEQIRAEFEQRFVTPASCVYNAEMDHYGWMSHPKTEHPFNAQYETWLAAQARYAPAHPQVPEGYATVEIKQLETLKGLLNAMSAFTAESMVDTMIAASQQPTTRTHLPEGTDRVRNVATGEVKSVGQEHNDG